MPLESAIDEPRVSSVLNQLADHEGQKSSETTTEEPTTDPAIHEPRASSVLNKLVDPAEQKGEETTTERDGGQKASGNTTRVETDRAKCPVELEDLRGIELSHDTPDDEHHPYVFGRK